MNAPTSHDPSANVVGGGLVDWATRTPDRDAVRDLDGALTFAELDGLVGTLARQLLERLDAGRRQPVAIPIVTGHDRWSAVAIHAAVRAGVPHAPLDAALPPAAIAELLARLGDPPFAIVCDEGRGRVLPSSLPQLVVPRRVDDPVAPRPIPVHDDAIAAVLFTSGSTGRPKGVVYAWRNLAARYADSARSFPGGAPHHLGITAPPHWLAGWGRLLIVSAGPSIAMQSPGGRDPLDVLEWFDGQGVNMIPLVPSLAARLVARWPSGRRLESVRKVRTFGETLEWAQVPAIRRLVGPDAVIENGYGATEASVAVAELQIRPDDPVGSGRVPLGFPVREGRVQLRPLEEDGPTEIVIVGTVAVGYLGDPDLTAARFGTDPDGTRWWRSGDLGEADGNGCLALTGRLDDLVKIRGRLVEPAEPERLLHDLDGVRRAVVLPREGVHGTRLVAHLELTDDSQLDPATVRAHLAAHLPPHLVPSPLVVHSSLPLNANNKVDRVGLRNVRPEPWRTTTPREPTDLVEADIVLLSAEILELDHVNVDDDLWELGLDSLAAVELVEACSELGWGRLEPTAPLEHPTPARLAVALREVAGRRNPHRPSIVVVLNAEGTRRPIVALPGAGGSSLGYHWLARALGPEQPLVVIEAQGLHTPGPPDRTLAALVARNVDAIVAVAPGGPITLLGYSAGGVVAYAVADVLHRRGRAVELVMLDSKLADEANAAPRVAVPRPEPTATSHAGPRSPARLRRFLRRPTRDRVHRLMHDARAGYRMRRPGQPTQSTARYLAFQRIGSRAIRGYDPPPPEFAVTHLHTGSFGAKECWSARGFELPDERLPGTHLTLLRPPNVERLAARIRVVHQRCDDAASLDAASP